MMWNTLMQGPMMNGTAVLYDGHPNYPTPDFLWSLVARTGATTFGTSPAYVQIMRQHGIRPKDRYALDRIESVLLIGSPAPPETFAYEAVKSDLWVTSQSGGTEFCSGLVGGVPIQPIYAGEIQARALGADVHAFNEAGEELIDEPGEL